jgi:hypothetical protein
MKTDPYLAGDFRQSLYRRAFRPGYARSRGQVQGPHNLVSRAIGLCKTGEQIRRKSALIPLYLSL